jgi:hypothetical protein
LTEKFDVYPAVEARKFSPLPLVLRGRAIRSKLLENAIAAPQPRTALGGQSEAGPTAVQSHENFDSRNDSKRGLLA